MEAATNTGRNSVVICWAYIDGLNRMVIQQDSGFCVIIVINHKERMDTVHMKKKDRLRRNFARVLKVKVHSGGGLSVFAVPGSGKIGIAVSKSVRGAVNRNRIKRQLRVFADKHILGKTKKDVVLVAGDPKFSKKGIKIEK